MKGPRPSCVSTGPLETPDDLTSDDLEISNDVAPARKMHKVADLAVPSSDQGKGLRDALDGKKKIVVVAGAGISVSAGVPDFRSKNGLFSGNGGKQMFDVSVYNNNEDIQSFHQMIINLWNITRHARKQTTTFHNMLATWAQNGRLRRLYTQNIDCLDISLVPLATRVLLGMKRPWPVTIQLHGGLDKMKCTLCGRIEDFDSSLFQGPEVPPCEECEKNDLIRTEHDGKRSRGVGRLRPRIVLYNEPSLDEDAIGKVTEADLRSVPDAVIVVGILL